MEHKVTRGIFFGLFFGGIFGMLTYTILDFYFGMGGIAPVLYITLLSIAMKIFDIFGRIKK